MTQVGPQGVLRSAQTGTLYPNAKQPSPAVSGKDITRLACLALRSEQYNRADQRLSRSHGLLVTYAIANNEEIGRSARELVNLRLMAPNDPRAVAAQDPTVPAQGYPSRSALEADIRSTVTTVSQRRLSLSWDGARRLQNLTTMVTMPGTVEPYRAAVASEGLALELRNDGQHDLALRVSHAAIKAARLALAEARSQQTSRTSESAVQPQGSTRKWPDATEEYPGRKPVRGPREPRRGPPVDAQR